MALVKRTGGSIQLRKRVHIPNGNLIKIPIIYTRLWGADLLESRIWKRSRLKAASESVIYLSIASCSGLDRL